MAGEEGQSLRILYIDTEKVWRGGQVQILDLMTGMQAKGHDVWLAAPNDSELFRRASNADIATVSFDQRHELSISAIIRIWKVLRENRFSLVHSNTPRTLVSAAFAARLSRTPAVFCSRRVDFPLRSRISRLKYNWITDRILTISSSIKETLVRGGVTRSLIEVVYEGLDLEWIDKQKAELLLQSDPGLVVGTVSHLSAEKGLPDLLQAFRISKQSFPQISLCLVGEGSLQEALVDKTKELGIEDSVQFLGFRSDSEALMKQFDIFCLPSLSEGLSSAIMAAMANRLPVVSTSVGGIPELVSDGETGFLVPPGDPIRLANALGRLLESPSLRLRMGEAGRRCIEKRFTVERKITATEKSYLKLLADRGIR